MFTSHLFDSFSFTFQFFFHLIIYRSTYIFGFFVISLQTPFTNLKNFPISVMMFDEYRFLIFNVVKVINILLYAFFLTSGISIILCPFKLYNYNILYILLINCRLFSPFMKAPILIHTICHIIRNESEISYIWKETTEYVYKMRESIKS